MQCFWCSYLVIFSRTSLIYSFIAQKETLNKPIVIEEEDPFSSSFDEDFNAEYNVEEARGLPTATKRPKEAKVAKRKTSKEKSKPTVNTNNSPKKRKKDKIEEKSEALANKKIKLRENAKKMAKAKSGLEAYNMMDSSLSEGECSETSSEEDENEGAVFKKIKEIQNKRKG